MPYFPNLTEPKTYRVMTDTFFGYNHGKKIRDGEFYDETNLSSTHFPLMANRGKRGEVSALTAPQGLIAKDALAYVDGATLYYNGAATQVTTLSVPNITRAATAPTTPSAGDYWYNTSTGITKRYGTTWTECPYPAKQLVSMGAYLCIFPDKVYFNTADATDYGSMEATYSSISESSITFTMCKADGTAYATPTISATEPESPSNGDLWIDSSAVPNTLKQYSSASSIWVDVPTVYTKITFSTQGAIPALFSVYDGVTLSGCVHTTAGTTAYDQIDALNGSKIIYALGGDDDANVDDYIVVVGLLNEAFTQSTGTVTIAREIPDMDFVCEAGNRLWGCYYGNDGEQNLNELYACALGDFKNWNRFMGISTDSWAAAVGSDGQWTGAVNYLGYPTFFKENTIHRVSISAAGAHAVDDTICRGVQKGSSKSLVVVNETLYYKSPTDVCAYQGSLPMGVSEALGDVQYFEASAGSYGKKYYLSMRTSAGTWSLFAYDIDRNLWHREDATHALAFSRVDAELYYIDAGSLKLMAENGTTGTLETSVSWQAVSGILYYEYPDRKYVSRYNFRLQMETGAKVDFYIQYDSDGSWVKAGTLQQLGTGTVTLAVRPRRCDHLQIKLSGTGNISLYSIARILEMGGDE